MQSHAMEAHTTVRTLTCDSNSPSTGRPRARTVVDLGVDQVHDQLPLSIASATRHAMEVATTTTQPGYITLTATQSPCRNYPNLTRFPRCKPPTQAPSVSDLSPPRPIPVTSDVGETSILGLMDHPGRCEPGAAHPKWGVLADPVTFFLFWFLCFSKFELI
jgi:hypothetical protein